MSTIVSVFDVTAYILEKRSPITAMKLQKLVYYCQAWSVVWDEQQLFQEELRAWANGPVVRELFDAHRGQYLIEALPYGDSSNLDKIQSETVDLVLNYYADRPSQWLSDLTHQEDPWLRAREGIPPGERSDRVISPESMEEYYSSL